MLLITMILDALKPRLRDLIIQKCERFWDYPML